MGMDNEQLVHILVAHDSESDAALFPVGKAFVNRLLDLKMLKEVATSFASFNISKFL
jgi:hypothetical protein